VHSSGGGGGGGGGWQWGHDSVEPMGRTRSDFAFYEGLHHQKKDMSTKVQGIYSPHPTHANTHPHSPTLRAYVDAIIMDVGFDIAFPVKLEKGHAVGTPYERVARRPLSARERAQRRRDGMDDQTLVEKADRDRGKTIRVVLHPTRRY
jgi:hypothetical protein